MQILCQFKKSLFVNIIRTLTAKYFGILKIFCTFYAKSPFHPDGKGIFYRYTHPRKREASATFLIPAI